MTLTTGRSAKPPRPAAGFTLLELVLVMLLVSLVMGMAAPSLRGFLIGRKSADAAAQVLALAHYARTQAVSAGAVCRLNVDPAARVYWLTMEKGGRFQELGTEFGRRFSLPEGVEACWTPLREAGHEYIEFFADGRTEAVSLQLTDREGRVFVIGCRSETEPLTVTEGSSR
jgi:prepilin-type N-terminal cleavage/methylation domain-containing protein